MAKFRAVKGYPNLMQIRLFSYESAYIHLLNTYALYDYSCLVPFTINSGNFVSTVVFDSKSLVSLPSYLKTPMDSGQFASLLDYLITAIDQAESVGLSLNSFLYDKDKIYVNVVHGTLSFILFDRLRGGKMPFQAFELFEMIGRDAEAKSFDDRRTMQDYINGLEALSNPNLDILKQYAASFAEQVHRGKRCDDSSTERVSIPLADDAFYDAKEASAKVSSVKEYKEIEPPGTVLMGRAAVSTDYPAITVTHTSSHNEWHIDSYPFFVGASPSSDLRIAESAHVSRHHAAFTYKDGMVFLEDSGSTNGTYVNNKEIEENEKVELHDGDVILFADERFDVSMDESGIGKHEVRQSAGED